MKLLLPLLLVSLLSSAAFADKNKHSTKELLEEAEQTMQSPEVSPVRRIEPKFNKNKNKQHNIIYRNIDGSFNNIIDDQMNVTDTQLIRVADETYGDGISAMGGTDRPNPRAISNAALSQTELSFASTGASDFLWQWGQFLDHDIDLTEGVHPAEEVPISIPAGDIHFDPNNMGNVVLAFNRSIYDTNTGTDSSNPRQQKNEITGWIDASNVYGSDDERAQALRRLDGSGKLKTSDGRLLPFNTDGLINAGGPSAEFFLAGDPRANEQIGLTVMHTLFVREHNRLARIIAKKNPFYSGERIYQTARRIVAAQMQVITYNEFLPILLGKNAIPKYEGYDPNIDARIANEFSTAAYRLGHSLLSPQILRIYKKRKNFDNSEISLREAFFAPFLLTKKNNIGSILRGLASQQCQELDVFVIDDVRNFLFGQPGSGGFDLASLNIQRGRDHGLGSYNQTRIALGLPAATSFEDISSDPDIQARLSNAYDNVDLIDLWVGGLAEDKVDGAMVGPVFYEILRDQFIRLRDGDRFWYENDMSKKEIRNIKKTTLAKIIRRNTGVGRELQNNVFLVK
ncbi:MAG: peroxidase family protein [Pseudomonadota bacterium]